jgi:hypothetical protein
VARFPRRTTYPASALAHDDPVQSERVPEERCHTALPADHRRAGDRSVDPLPAFSEIGNPERAARERVVDKRRETDRHAWQIDMTLEHWSCIT